MQNKLSSRLLPAILPARLPSAFWLTAAYLTIGILWIMFSDTLASKLAGSNESAFEKIQSIKGILFVLLSGSLLFILSNRFYKNINNYWQQKTTTEEKFLALYEIASEGIFDYNISDKKATLNNKMKFFFPHKGNEIEDFWKTFQQRAHPEDILRLSAEYNEVLITGRQTWQTELRLLGSDNKYHTAISSIYIINNNFSGKPQRLIGTLLDVSDLRNLQAEYYEQELKHKRTIAASIIRAQEIERNRWAEELHDNVCQILSVANMYAGNICKDPSSISTTGPELKKLILESVTEIRQLSASIKTPSFTKESLREVLEKLAANINRANPIEFRLTTDSFDETKICSEQKLMVYRVVQEQVNNVIKYAAASLIEVKLAILNNDNVQISVRDNGKGFEPGKVRSGIGLENIRSRLQVYKGNMDIQSSPGHGCTLLATFKITNT